MIPSSDAAPGNGVSKAEQRQKKYIWEKQCTSSIRKIGRRLGISTRQVRKLYDEALRSGEYPFPE